MSMATLRRALLVIAHGSPRESANEDLYRVLNLCKASADFDIVQEAFLECNRPDIPTGIDICAEAGAGEIVAVPFFLHTGKHVARDLPALLEEARLRHPKVTFRLGQYIGRSPYVTEIIVKRLELVRERKPSER